MDTLDGLPEGAAIADLHIARGLDYYTGTVYEGVFVEHPQLGAVCSGGRYDNLASDDKHKLPGVGVSLGISRILGLCSRKRPLKASRPTPTVVLVALTSDEDRPRCLRGRQGPARAGRGHRGLLRAAEVRKADPLRREEGHPLRAVSRRGRSEVRDIRSGVQSLIEVEAGCRPPRTLRFRCRRSPSPRRASEHRAGLDELPRV